MQAVQAFHIFVTAALVGPILTHHGFAVKALDQGCLSARATNKFIFDRKHSQLCWLQRFRLLLAVCVLACWVAANFTRGAR